LSIPHKFIQESQETHAVTPVEFWIYEMVRGAGIQWASGVLLFCEKPARFKFARKQDFPAAELALLPTPTLNIRADETFTTPR